MVFQIKNAPLVSDFIVEIRLVNIIFYFTLPAPYISENCINPFQDGLFRGCSRMGGPKRSPLPKICHTYPTMMKPGTIIPYQKKIQKYMNHVTHPMSSADINIFHRKSANFAISRNTEIDCILIHNFYLF